MDEPLYVSRARIEPSGPLQQRASLPLGATAEMGVHGPIVELFHLDPPRPLPLPVDYIVAATGG